MITHQGFVFMTPTGTYLRRVDVLGHGCDKVAFVNAPTLDQATLFPNDRPPSDSKNQDWTAITAGRLKLVSLPAISRLTTELDP